MVRKSFSLALIILLMLTFLIGCSKKEDQQTAEISQQETGGEEQLVQTIKPKPINYDSMLVVISQLVDSIKSQPENVQLREKLVAASYDTTWETILSAGFGTPFKNTENESVARKYAEQAAAADAYRWAAYIKRWYQNPASAEFGSLNVEIKGGRIVAKKMSYDQTAVVLVEIRSSAIPD